MAPFLRIGLWMVWAIAIGWLWRAGLLGAAPALAALSAGLVLAAWRSGHTRRKRSELRYVQTGKAPLA